MSYALAITDTAFGHLRQLPTWLQEETLDELERLISSTAPASGGAVPVRVADFTRNRDSDVHYVFITLEWDAGAAVLRVLTIGHHHRTS